MLESIVTVYPLFTTLTGLILCFFYYVEHVRREYQLLIGFLLGDFLSNYYWVVFFFVTGDYPDSSELLAYFGWNIGYVMLFLLARRIRGNEARGFFHPLMLVPVPLNIAQFLLYIQYGGYFNNAWQGIFCTLVVVYSLQGILHHRKHKANGGSNHPACIMLLMLVLFQYGAFTASCFDWPSELLNPYTYCTVIQYTIHIFLPVAIARIYKDKLRESGDSNTSDFRKLLRAVFMAMVVITSIAGYLLAGWMQSLLMDGTGDALSESNSRIIMIMLFIISVALSILIITILIALGKGQKKYETSSFAKEEALGGPHDSAPESGFIKKDTSEGDRSLKDTIRRRWNLILPLLITFILMTMVVIYTSLQFYRISVEKSYEDASVKSSATAEQLQNYMDTAKSVLWVTADTVEYMLANGESDRNILRYLEQETENQQVQFDENYTGVYGYIRGLYMDGSGWEPPADYKPEERDWYRAAMEAGDEVTIAQPYVDMQTGSVVISICKRLEDDQSSVLSLDLIIGYIQGVVEETNVSGIGYCLVLDGDGTVIAHRDTQMNGQDIYEYEYGTRIMQLAGETPSGHFETDIDGKRSTVFVDQVMEQWRVMIVIENGELFSSVNRILVINILTFLIVFILIAAFYSISYRREERSSREAQNLRIREHQQAYEAEILRLEKQSADAANEAKSSFLADMSHEIRTPINAVLGMNEMILRESTSESITTYARNVESAGKNLLSIINDILDFSKIEAGKMEIVDATYQLSSVLNDVSNMITFRARSKDLAFHVDVDESIPDRLFGDEVRIRQIVTNILTNAVKYTMEGSVSLIVNAERKEDGKIDLLIDVKDTGIGIKEEDIGKLFTKFGRVDLQQTNTIEGTGLGLAITENLLLMMKGDIRVQSVYGEGTTFSIRIPQGIVSEEAIGDFHQRFEEGLKNMKTYQESFHAPEARILVVDDTELNLVVIEGLLKTTQVKLDTATGGTSALRLTRDTPYDLILLDQRMPHMSGTEALQHIRAQEGGCNRETPVICLTADAVQGARERYLAEGFSGYLSKPVEGHALEAALIQHLPAEKIVRTSVHGEEAWESPRRPISMLHRLYYGSDMLDFEEAIKYSTSEELLERAVNVFYDTLPEKIADVERISIQSDYENYTILVHALKSGTQMIGAPEISELAKELEAYGNAVRNNSEGKEEAIHSIQEKTPELLSVLRELKDYLKPFFEKDRAGGEPLPEMTEEELDELFEAIREFAGLYDQDGILNLLTQTEGYAIPETEKERIEQIKKCAQNSDWSGVNDVMNG